MAMVAIQNQHKAAAVVPSEAAAMAASKSASAAACLAELELAAAERAWRKQAVDRAKPLLTTTIAEVMLVSTTSGPARFRRSTAPSFEQTNFARVRSSAPVIAPDNSALWPCGPPLRPRA